MTKLHTVNAGCTKNITYLSEYVEVNGNSDDQEIEEGLFLSIP